MALPWKNTVCCAPPTYGETHHEGVKCLRVADGEVAEIEATVLDQGRLDGRLVCCQPLTHGSQGRRLSRSAAQDEGEVRAGRVVTALLRQRQHLRKRRAGHQLGGACSEGRPTSRRLCRGVHDEWNGDGEGPQMVFFTLTQPRFST